MGVMSSNQVEIGSGASSKSRPDFYQLPNWRTPMLIIPGPLPASSAMEPGIRF
jgi:hypothetical protein